MDQPARPGPLRAPVGPVAVAADAVRVLGLVSIVAAFTLGPVDGALFALVLGGLLIPRVLEVPAPLDLTYGVSVLVAAWSASLGAYEAVGWWDLAVHLVTTGAVAAVAVLAFARLGTVRMPARSDGARLRVGLVLMSSVVGLALSLVWELGEWAGHTFLDDSINVGYGDTIGDMAAGGLGSLVAGVLLTAWVVRHGRASGAAANGSTAASVAS